jgi:hypothetical protein
MFYDIKYITQFQSFQEKTVIWHSSLQRGNAVFGQAMATGKSVVATVLVKLTVYQILWSRLGRRLEMQPK